MIIDECKYMRDSHFVNSTELKEKYTYIHTCMIFDGLLAHLILLNGPTIAESTLRDLL